MSKDTQLSDSDGVVGYASIIFV